MKLQWHKRKCAVLFYPVDVLLIYLCTWCGFNLCHICCSFTRLSWASVPMFTSLAPNENALPYHGLAETKQSCFVKFCTNVCEAFFSDRSFRPSPIKTNAPALFASATPSRPVKIDSLASSMRQLWAICSHLGSSSSFCFYNCSYNIMHAEWKN